MKWSKRRNKPKKNAYPKVLHPILAAGKKKI
jgi:hypothetical protein